MKMTITRALAELKTLDSRITKKLREIDSTMDVSVGSKLRNFPQLKIEDFNKEAKEKIQSLKDLFSRRIAIKTAIAKSNLETKVKVGKRELTVLEVIVMKSYIGDQRIFLTDLENIIRSSIATVQKLENENKAKIESLAELEIRETCASGKATKEIKEDIIEKYTKIVESSSKITLQDPAGCQELAKTLRDEIDEFEHEADFVLSESNSTTFIEIPD